MNQDNVCLNTNRCTTDRNQFKSFFCMLSLQQSHNIALVILSVQTNTDLVTGKGKEKILTLKTTQITKPHIQIIPCLLTVRKPPERRIWAQYYSSNKLSSSRIFIGNKTPTKSYYNLMDNSRSNIFISLVYCFILFSPVCLSV